MSVVVVGADTLARTARAAADDLRSLAEPARGAAEEISARASAGAPRLTGALAGGFTTRITGPEAQVVNNLIYAGVQEYGWPARNISGHHMLANATRSAPWLDKYRAALADALSKVRGTL